MPSRPLRPPAGNQPVVSVDYDTVYDYVIVGAGNSGMNCLQAVLDVEPDAKCLVVDKREEVGGCWNEFYSFVKLHQPASVFGVSGYTKLWVQDADATLASRLSILDHFQRVAASLPPNVSFLLSASFTESTKDDAGLFNIGVALPSDAKKTLKSKNLIDARAFNYLVPEP